MEEFNQMWADQQEDANELSLKELNTETPEYQLRDGTAKYKILANLLGHYYYAKHGEPMADIFTETQNSEINFHL